VSAPKLTEAQRTALETGGSWSTLLIMDLERMKYAKRIGPGRIEVTDAGRAALRGDTVIAEKENQVVSASKLSKAQREILAKVAAWDDSTRFNMSIIMGRDPVARRLIAKGFLCWVGVGLRVTDSGRAALKESP